MLRTAGPAAFAREVLVPLADVPLAVRFAGAVPFFEVHGAQRVREGKYRDALRLHEHLLPFERALAAWRARRVSGGPGVLRVLITNLRLDSRTGSEIVTRNLAEALIAAGHRPVVYRRGSAPSPRVSRARSVPVVEDVAALGGAFDVIHVHHLPTAAAALARFPDVPAVFVSHDFRAWHDAPLAFPSVRRVVAVDATVAERLIGDGIAPAALRVVFNQPDLTRFSPGRRCRTGRGGRWSSPSCRVAMSTRCARPAVRAGSRWRSSGATVGHVLEAPSGGCTTSTWSSRRR